MPRFLARMSRVGASAVWLGDRLFPLFVALVLGQGIQLLGLQVVVTHRYQQSSTL